MIIVIVGPTGVGKTKLSITLAKQLNGEVINGDSMQVYKELNIGTAKATIEEMDGVKHHLLDIVNPTDMYTVKDFQKDCRSKIEELKQQIKIPIIVGGTGLYLKAVFYDYEFFEEPEQNNYESLTNEELYKEVLTKYPNTTIHINNRKRLVRTLNRKETTNKGDRLLYQDVVFIGLTKEREELYKKIDERVDNMILHGLLKEVETLYKNNIRGKAIDTGIGYKELYHYFDKTISLDEAITLIKKNSRHYAKRQMTWFRNKMEVKWFETNFKNFDETETEVLDYLKQLL